jgi:hypothetical protein
MDPADIARAQQAMETVRPLLGSEPATLVVEAGGERVTLSAEQVRSLMKVVNGIAGRPAAQPDVLSYDAAAELLSLPVSILRRLIDRGYLHPRMTGSSSVLLRSDVLAYREKQAQIRREALDNLTRFAEEVGP